MPTTNIPTKRHARIVPYRDRRMYSEDRPYQQRQLFADWLAARRARIVRSPLRAFRAYLVDRNVFQHGERLTNGTLKRLTPYFGAEFIDYIKRGDHAPTDELIARIRPMKSEKPVKLYIDGVSPDSPYYRPPLGPLRPPRREPDPWELEEARKMQIELRTLEHDQQREHREQFAAWLGDRDDIVSPRRMYKFWRGVAVEHPTYHGGWSRGMKPHARLAPDVHEQLGRKFVDLITLSPPIKRSLLRATLDPPPAPTEVSDAH